MTDYRYGKKAAFVTRAVRQAAQFVRDYPVGLAERAKLLLGDWPQGQPGRPAGKRK